MTTVQSAAMTDIDTDLLERAAHMCESYAEFIRSDVMSADIERHPYLPELEGVAEDLRTLAARPVTPAPAVYIVCTGEVVDGRETYTRHDERPLMCDYETLYAEHASAPEALSDDARDAQRYRCIRNAPYSDRHGDLYAMCFQGDGDIPLQGSALDDAADAALAAPSTPAPVERTFSTPACWNDAMKAATQAQASAPEALSDERFEEIFNVACSHCDSNGLAIEPDTVDGIVRSVIAALAAPSTPAAKPVGQFIPGFTADESMAYWEASQPAATQAQASEPLALINWQQRALDHGFKYWRASDAHGVTATQEQALNLLRDLLGVEVDVEGEVSAPAATSEPEGHPVAWQIRRVEERPDGKWLESTAEGFKAAQNVPAVWDVRALYDDHVDDTSKMGTAERVAWVKGHSEGWDEGYEGAIEAAAKACQARIMGDNNREDVEACRCADAVRALKGAA